MTNTASNIPLGMKRNTYCPGCGSDPVDRAPCDRACFHEPIYVPDEAYVPAREQKPIKIKTKPYQDQADIFSMGEFA